MRPIRIAPYFPSFLIALAVIAGPLSSAERVSNATIARLCEHVKARKMMHVDRSQPEVIWSDGAMFEVATTFPRELEELLAPVPTRDLRPILKRMVPDPEKGWLEARVVRKGSGKDHASVASKDGAITLEVASPYFDYLHERYPGARLWIKGPLDAVLFLVDGTLRGSVMPIAQARPRADQPR